MTDPTTLPPLPESARYRHLAEQLRHFDPDSRLLALRSLLEAARLDLGHRGPTLSFAVGPCLSTRSELLAEMDRMAAFLNPRREVDASSANPTGSV